MTTASGAEQPVTNKIIDLDGCSYKLSIPTSASKKTIWRLWADVENWKDYDTILEYSYLEDDAKFEVGATGYVNARGAPKTKFELIEVNSGKSFVESLKLPLYNQLELKRYFEKNAAGQTIFTHEVEFKGPLKSLMYLLLANTFKKELPLVMGRLKALAEKHESESSDSAI